jgi:hypothetical protein
LDCREEVAFSNKERQMSGAAAGAVVAAAAATAQAIKASGVMVQVDPGEFLLILERQPAPLVVHATGGFLTTVYQYLTSYKGLAFYAKSSEPLHFSKEVELIQAGSIWIPG